MRKTLLMLMILFVAFGFTASKKIITVKGSDTMVILAQRWAEKYMQKHKDISIQVTGGGSGTGIAALINGTTDICNSSREIKDSERQLLKQKFNSFGVEIRVAIDGLSVYLNQTNPVKELTMQQIRDIYLGKITNWKEVGGNNAKIIVYGRENNSGTYVFFKEHVLDGADYVSSMQSLPGTAAVANAVSKDKNAIGYGGAAYAKGIKDVSIKKDKNSKAYLPKLESIKSGVYPLSRFLYLYTIKKPEGAVKEFIDWILSKEGQSIVSEVGYFTVR
ncbi:MAG: phosphate-binding protein [Ignavibacteriales bacterium CG_4_9_14_3_um_filter_34_10]|nr:MAG: phosphate-binding protein [Ignavibacteriales bacterium CG_4_9_14_3_um_filter_34_10]